MEIGCGGVIASKLAMTSSRRKSLSRGPSSPVALLEFLAVAARARVVATDVFQGIAHGFLMGVAAIRAVHMAVIVIVIVVMVMIVVAIRAMDMGLLGHRGYSAIKSAAIITPLRSRCT